MSESPTCVFRAEPSRLAPPRRLGWWLLAIGGGSSFLALGAAASVALVLSGVTWLRVLMAGIAAVVSIPTLLVLWMGLALLRGIHRAAKLELEIGPEGLRQLRPSRRDAPWQSVVEVHIRNQGNGLWLYVHSDRERNVISVALEGLDRPAEVIDAIGRYWDGQIRYVRRGSAWHGAEGRPDA